MKRQIILTLPLLFGIANLWAQLPYSETEIFTTNLPKASLKEDPLPNSSFLVAGYYTLELEAENGEANFSETKFNPIFLWQKGQKIFFQSEVEFELRGSENGIEQEINLEYAVMNLLLGNNAVLYSGKFIAPIGTFTERYHPDWINRAATKPIGLGKPVNGLKLLQPGGEIGIGIKGAVFVGNGKVNYNMFISNGAVLDSLNGMLRYDNLLDNNTNKAIGGRIGLMPIPGSTLELGLSGYTAKVGSEKGNYEDTTVRLLALDINYVKAISGFGKIDIKGQYQTLGVNTTNYENNLVIDNSSKVWYAQCAYQLPSISDKVRWLSNIEVVSRYTQLDVPASAPWGEDLSQLTLGINYWIRWNAAFKVAIDFFKSDADAETGATGVFTMGF